MLNSLEVYTDAGRKAAVARNERDEMRALFHTNHFQRMITLETTADKAPARKAFDDGYKDARRVPSVPFR